MQKHTKIYMDYFGYDISSWIACEICGGRGIDVHHIENRKSGGTKKEDTIENLMCLCRPHHVEFGDKKQYKDFLKNKHQEFMDIMGKK